MPYAVASRLSTGLDIGGFIVKGNFIGPGFPANTPGRERIAGCEVTRNVPDDVWQSWEARASFEARGTVYGSQNEQELSEWCWRSVRSHGHAHGAPQDGTSAMPISRGTR